VKVKIPGCSGRLRRLPPPTGVFRRPVGSRRGLVRDARARLAGEAAPLRHQDFERLYAAHSRPLLAFLVYRTGDRALAEDLLGETFERVLRTSRRFDRLRGTEKAWLYTIALNCLRDNARRAAAEHRALDRTATDADPPNTLPTDAVLERDLVSRGLETLSADERLAVALRFGADLTMPEIAKVIGEPLTTVEGRIYRALGKLRAEFGSQV